MLSVKLLRKQKWRVRVCQGMNCMGSVHCETTNHFSMFLWCILNYVIVVSVLETI